MTLYDKLYSSAKAAFASTLGELFWYALAASVAWLIFYVAFAARLRHRRISAKDPSAGQVRGEILRSLRSIAVFGLVTLAVIFAGRHGWTRLYRRIDEYGYVWLVLSVVVMAIMHDAYFYWTHRLMHHRLLFKFFHRTHHLSTSPTPWAAYAFSPAEALVQAGIGPLIVCTLPVHSVAFAAFMVWQILFNVLGHCGYEIFPRWFLRSPGGWVLNSVTHHAMHHEKFRANYGLYFNVWDRLMGTNHAEYHERFEGATAAPPAAVPSSDGSRPLREEHCGAGG